MILARRCSLCALCFFIVRVVHAQVEIDQSSPLHQKADYFQQDLLAHHWLDGLYVSIVPVTSGKQKLSHTVDEPGNVIHAGVWTGRYLAGVGYQYAVTGDPAVRQHGGQILVALRRLQEVTGKPGLLARGYVMGHGPVMDYERDGRDSAEWHQGAGEYADYRWYGDVSVDNFNAVLYGYAVYYDLAADTSQRDMIRHDVERLMTHLLDHHCRIVDVDGEVTLWGHVGIDPDPDRDDYYEQLYAGRRRFYGADGVGKMPLRASLMLLPDLLIAHHITGDDRYLLKYQQVVKRFRDNPEPDWRRDEDEQQRLARTNHSSEGQSYEALYNLLRYEQDPELVAIYRQWLLALWERNWREGNSLFTYMTLVLFPEYRAPASPGAARSLPDDLPHAIEGLRWSNESLVRYPLDRVFRPVMNSLRDDIPRNPRSDTPQSLDPLPIDQRPLDNEYAWKGNPYQLDGWLKPTITSMAFACDDPQVAWFCDSGGRLSMTVDGGNTWRDATTGLMGASIQDIVASPARTFVLWAKTDHGLRITRDGGLSWRDASTEEAPDFPDHDYAQWCRGPNDVEFRIEADRLVRRHSGGDEAPAMNGWRIPFARSLFATPWGVVASGPGGSYLTKDGKEWTELNWWREDRTGAADFLHAYWMGRYYGYIAKDL